MTVETDINKGFNVSDDITYETTRVKSLFRLPSEENLLLSNQSEANFGKDNTPDYVRIKNLASLSIETWESAENISARVYHLKNEIVICDCLIDPDNVIFEKREFPKYLFDKLNQIKEGTYIILKFRYKNGSMRLDVIDGEGIVNPKIFEDNRKWDELNGF